MTVSWQEHRKNLAGFFEGTPLAKLFADPKSKEYYGPGEYSPGFITLGSKPGCSDEQCRFCTNSIMNELMTVKGYSVSYCAQCGAIKEMTWTTPEESAVSSNKTYKEEWSALNFDKPISLLTERIKKWIEEGTGARTGGDWHTVMECIIKEELGLAPKSGQSSEESGEDPPS